MADTGGTAIPFTLNQQKANSAFGTPGIADARISATAALTAGTYTRDSNPFARIQGVTGTVLGTYVFGGGAASLGAGKVDLWVPGVTPFQMSFAPNEGIVIQNPLIGPATGSITLLIEMGWTEVAAN